MSSVLAHAGGTGWDEIALTIAPLVLAGVIFGRGRQRTPRTENADVPAAETKSTG